MIRLSDIALSLFGILFTLPFFIIICLLLFLTGGWRIFHSMERIGKYGKPYRHVKFRTMRPGREFGRVFFEQDRITRIGKILRGSHLDELPELWLILTGMMSFSGPRPLPEKLLEGLDTSSRETVRPGWTGPAQIVLLRKGKLNKHLQLRLDNCYIRRRSLSRHWKLIFATLFFMFYKKGKADLTPDATPDRREFAGKTGSGKKRAERD